jgi:hypothetical protein
MGAKGNTFITALLDLIFNNVAAANIGNTAGLQPSSVAGSLYVSLHTADPGAGGSQNTSEAAYTGYARVAVARSSGGWTISGQNVAPAATIVFPPGTAGGETCTFAAIGTAASGAGEILYRGALTPNIVTGNGITPELPTSSMVTEA